MYLLRFELLVCLVRFAGGRFGFWVAIGELGVLGCLVFLGELGVSECLVGLGELGIAICWFGVVMFRMMCSLFRFLAGVSGALSR